MGSAARLTVLPETVAMFHAGQGEVMATRFPGAGGHEFLVLSLSAEAVLGIFGGRAAIPGRNYGLLRRWTERERQIYRDLRSVPVAEVAHAAWYQAKVMELLSLHLFHARAPEPLFCTEVKIRGHRHVREALGLLRARLAEPLDLARLARDVGCAPHYLSRLVSQETGKTLSLHLRKFRIERARELLAGNRLSVTEVAFEVGYSSLSHFSKAFALEAGLTPSDFLKRQRA